MNAPTIVKRTQAELIDELIARFGTDPAAWAFICPSCNDIATVADFREALFRGPEFIIMPDGHEAASFAIAPATTGEKP